MSVEELKGAIIELSEDDRLQLTSWLNLQSMDEWDLQIQRDFSPQGKGSKALAQWRSEVADGLAEGTVRPLEEGLSQRGSGK